MIGGVVCIVTHRNSSSFQQPPVLKTHLDQGIARWEGARRPADLEHIGTWDQGSRRLQRCDSGSLGFVSWSSQLADDKVFPPWESTQHHGRLEWPRVKTRTWITCGHETDWCWTKKNCFSSRKHFSPSPWCNDLLLFLLFQVFRKIFGCVGRKKEASARAVK